MDLLKPTVKRDLSLFSALSWQKGYLYYIKQKLGWSYPLYLHYNGRQVNFYHNEKDFKYFKQAITQNLINDKTLFEKLNLQFQKDVYQLKTKKIGPQNILQISNLIAKVMSFYIFIVSDTFVTAQPRAWESRNLSQEILYEVDEKIEKLLNSDLSHFMTPQEAYESLTGRYINKEEITKRKTGYILFQQKIITDIDFPEFCRRQNLMNPEQNVESQLTQLTGSIAQTGEVIGKAKIIYAARHLKKVQEGDILITQMTNINYTEAIIKSAGLITDEGGITSHAALIARELKKPCITNTKIATQIFHDGDLLKVDANLGLITKI